MNIEYIQYQIQTMEEGAISVTHIQDTISTPIYSTIALHSFQFRIFTTEYSHNFLLIIYSCFFWISTVFATTILVFCHSLHLQPYPFLLTLAGALIPLNLFAIYRRQILGKHLVASSILFNLIVIALFILLSLRIHYSGLAFGLYMAFQTISNCCFGENRGKVLLKLLMLVQFLIICLRLDEAIALEWKETLFGLIIIFFFLMATAACIFMYSLLISSGCLMENCHEIKQPGLKYIALNLLTLASLIAIPIWTVFINHNYHIPAFVAIAIASFTSFFSFLKRTEISLFICNTLEIINKDQPRLQIQSKNVQGMPHLFRVSENWYVQKYDPLTCENDLAAQECVVCMESTAEAVWQPCGHCVLCQKCMRQMLSSEIITCPLCKAQPSSIVRLQKKDELSSAILGKNEYQICECLCIKQM